MADRYWIGGDATNPTHFSVAANWSASSGGAGGASVPGVSDAVIFDTNSNGDNCVLTANISVLSINSDANHSANFDQAGYTISTVNDHKFEGTGNVTLDAAVTMTGDGDFYLKNTLTSATFSDCDLDLKGTGLFDVEWQNQYFKSLTCAYASKTTTKAGLGNNNGVQQLTLGTGTFTVSDDLSIRGSNVTPIVNAGATINGNSRIEVRWEGGTATDVVLIPAMTFSGTGANGLYLEFYSDPDGATLKLTGNIVCVNEFKALMNGGQEGIFDTDGYNITADDVLIAVVGTSSEMTAHFRDSAIDCTDFRLIDGGGRDSVYNFNSSTINFTGDFTITKTGGGTIAINPGTSVVTADGTGTQQITFGGFSLNILKTTNTAGELQILDASDCAEWDFAPAATIKFKESVSHTLSSYTTGDIDGTSGNLATLRSLSDGTAWDFVNPASMSVSYVDVKDSNATNEVDASDGTNVDSTGNTNWNFASFLAAWAAANSNKVLINGEQI